MFNYDPTIGIRNPFDDRSDVSIKRFMRDNNKISIVFSNITMRTPYADSDIDKTCLQFKLSIDYTSMKTNYILPTLETYYRNCNIFEEDGSPSPNLIFALIVCFLAFINLILFSKKIFEDFIMLMKYQYLYSSVNYLDGLEESMDFADIDRKDIKSFKINWENNEFSNRLNPFKNFWLIFGILANIMEITISILWILSDRNKWSIVGFTITEIFIGLSAFMAWIYLLSFINLSTRTRFLNDVFVVSKGNLLRFLINILPFYFGYVFAATMIFWKYDLFSTPMSSFSTLLAVSLGDTVLDVLDIALREGIIAQLFLITYILLFYTIIQNIIIAILMSGYGVVMARLQIERRKRLMEKEIDINSLASININNVDESLMEEMLKSNKNENLLKTSSK